MTKKDHKDFEKFKYWICKKQYEEDKRKNKR